MLLRKIIDGLRFNCLLKGGPQPWGYQITLSCKFIFFFTNSHTERKLGISRKIAKKYGISCIPAFLFFIFEQSHIPVAESLYRSSSVKNFPKAWERHCLLPEQNRTKTENWGVQYISLKK